MKPFPFLGRFSGEIYSIARVVVGFLFLQHGAQKLFAVLTERAAADFFSRTWFAGVIEFFGGGLIMLGLFTPWVAFLASGEMAVAYFIQHNPRGFWPILNAGEGAAFYCFVYLYFASRDSGPWSLDRLIWGGKGT